MTLQLEDPQLTGAFTPSHFVQIPKTEIGSLFFFFFFGES